MAKKFLNIKDESKIYSFKNSKPPSKKKAKQKAINCLLEAKKFISMFSGNTEDIDFAIAYLTE